MSIKSDFETNFSTSKRSKNIFIQVAYISYEDRSKTTHYLLRQKNIYTHTVERLEHRNRKVNSLKNWVSEPDSLVFFHIRKWASNAVLRRTFQLQSALENFLYIGNTCYKYAKVSLNVPYDKKGIEVIGAFTKKLYAKQKKTDSKKYSLGTTVPICCKLTKMTTERFFSQNPKIVKNCPNLTRKHSKGLHDLKLSKTIRFIMMKHVEKNLFKFLSRGLP